MQGGRAAKASPAGGVFGRWARPARGLQQVLQLPAAKGQAAIPHVRHVWCAGGGGWAAPASPTGSMGVRLPAARNQQAASPSNMPPAPPRAHLRTHTPFRGRTHARAHLALALAEGKVAGHANTLQALGLVQVQAEAAATVAAAALVLAHLRVYGRGRAGGRASGA